MPEITLVQAVNLALARAMADDPSVLVVGEDVGAEGGVFRATEGLLDRFGADRVLDTPLAEGVIAGMSVGLAAQGFRPVSEIQFTGFIYPTIDQLVNHASRLRTRTRGRLTCPMVMRSPYGAGIRAVEHHSESPEAMFVHIPGLRVVIPSSPARAYGLLLAAIRDPDPVVFLEPTRLYRAAREEVEDDGAALPLDHCFVLREGTDITLRHLGRHDQGDPCRRRSAGGRRGQRRGHRRRDIEAARQRRAARVGRQDRPLRHRARGAADRRRRGRDRRPHRRAGSGLAARPDRAGRRLGHGHAVAAPRAAIPAERSPHPRRRPPGVGVSMIASESARCVLRDAR